MRGPPPKLPGGQRSPGPWPTWRGPGKRAGFRGGGPGPAEQGIRGGCKSPPSSLVLRGEGGLRFLAQHSPVGLRHAGAPERRALYIDHLLQPEGAF